MNTRLPSLHRLLLRGIRRHGLLACVLAVASAGCGDTGATSASTDASVDDALSGYTPDQAPDSMLDLGFQFSPPQVVAMGGPVLHHPALVTVTFANETRRTQFEAFASWIVGSNWLATVGAEYGVGAGTVGGAVQLQVTPPAQIDLADVENFVAGGIMDGSIPRPADGLGNAIYLLYYPSSTKITATSICGQSIQSCVDWSGFHHDGHKMGLDFAYALLPDCGDTIPLFEEVASHEIIEAATNPYASVTPAYQLKADPTDPWYAYYGSCQVEVGDLCENQGLTVTEAGHTAQRSWSNAAALAGTDPCLPLDPKKSYFNAAASPTTIQHIASGASVVYTLHGYAAAAMESDWNLRANVVGLFGNPSPIDATATLSAKTLGSGGTATLTVTVMPGATAGSMAFVELTSQHNLLNPHLWVVGFTTP